jgi:S1-C subfamily serine protease
MGATDAPGLRVAGTTAGGPAAEAGLRGGDIIVELAGMPVGNIYEFTAALDRLRIGQTVPIVVLREGARVTLSITPASRE